MMMILPFIIISTLCGQIWPSVAQITIVVEPSPPEQQISQSIYLVGLEGKHFLYNDVTLMKLQRTKVAPAAGSTVVGSASSSAVVGSASSSAVVGSASSSYRIAEHCQFVQVNAQYVRDLADENVHAIVISLLSRQRKSFTIPIELFMVDDAIITVNFEKGITKTQILWKNTDFVNSNIESGQDKRHQIKTYLTEKYRKGKQQRNEKVALMLTTGKMEVEEEKEEGEI